MTREDERTVTVNVDINAVTLAKGAHDSPDEGLCLMEAVAYVQGLPHTDHPPCVSPILGAFGRSLNDALPEDVRQELKPFVALLPGTAADGHDEARGYLALDWLIRVYTPAWLELAGISAEARQLRELGRIVDLASAQRAGPVVRAGREKAAAAGDAAWDAAGDAAGDAARDAARDAAGAAARAATWAAAWAAAWDAAGAAARDAAGAAAWDAAWDAAWAAAWAAAGAAARDAARDALTPTVLELQRSAIRLYRAMITVGGSGDS